MSAPIDPPIKIKTKTKMKPLEKLPTDKKVTVTAITIPKIPNRFPCLEVSGEDRPLKASINIHQKLNKKLLISLQISLFTFFLFFIHC